MKSLVACVINFIAMITTAVIGFWMPWVWTLFVIGLFLLPVTTFLFIWFWLAPNNYFFTFVQESTAKIVVKGDAFAKALIQWEGYTLARADAPNRNIVKWDVVPERTQQPLFGGLRFYGFWPIWDIFIYTLRWHDIQKTVGGEEPQFHEQVLDYALLRPDVYWTKLLRAETGGEEKERIPIDVEFLTTMRVVNPYKALFVAPIGWVENVLLRLTPVYRGFIASRTIDDLLALKGKGEEIWKALAEGEGFNLITKVLEKEWGIKIEENGIQIKDIGLPEEYQKAAAARRKQELQAAGRAAETIGTVISMMAQTRGVGEKVIREEINASDNAAMRQEFLNLSRDLLVRKLGIEGGSYLDIRVGGAEGLERIILNALAAWQRMPGVKKSEGEG